MVRWGDVDWGETNAQEVLLVVSEPAMSWVRASAVSSSLPSFAPFSSRPSIRRASKSTLVVLSATPGCSLSFTRATAMPASFSTASSPLRKKGSGRYFAHGFSPGRHPSVALTSPRRLSTSTAGAYVIGASGVLRTSAISLPCLSIPKGAPNARSPMMSKAR